MTRPAVRACAWCGRTLRTPASRAVGIGPVCAQALGLTPPRPPGQGGRRRQLPGQLTIPALTQAVSTTAQEVPTVTAPPEYRVGACRSCAAPVIWAHTASRKRIPVDAAPSAAGVIALSRHQGGGRLLADVIPAADRDGRVDLRTAHHHTCPDGAAWRTKARRPARSRVPRHRFILAADADAADHRGRRVCATCQMPGAPGDPRHPTDAPTVPTLPPALADAARARDAAVLGETGPTA